MCSADPCMHWSSTFVTASANTRSHRRTGAPERAAVALWALNAAVFLGLARYLLPTEGLDPLVALAGVLGVVPGLVAVRTYRRHLSGRRA